MNASHSPRDSNVEALSALHEDLKTAARHQETVSMAIIAAQFALLVGTASAVGTIPPNGESWIKCVLLASNVLGNFGAVLLLIAHSAGRLRHMVAARHLRRRLAKAAGSGINTMYEKTFKQAIEGGSRRGDLHDFLQFLLQIITKFYDWLFVLYGAIAFLLSIVLVIVVLPSRIAIICFAAFSAFVVIYVAVARCAAALREPEKGRNGLA